MTNELHIALGVTIPDEAVTRTIGILAQRGMGKTYTAAVVCEELSKARMPVVIIDPLGVWWGLRVAADGAGVGIVAETIEQVFRERGYAVSRNKPYAGGFITEHYGNPAAGLHSIQIEINRALYMDERRYERSPGFGKLAADLVLLADRLAEIPLEELKPYRAAAE